MNKILVFGLLIFITGFGLLLVGTPSQGSSSTGGVIFIGPIPIVFGSGPTGLTLALLSVVIGGVMVALVLIWGWSLMKTKRD